MSAADNANISLMHMTLEGNAGNQSVAVHGLRLDDGATDFRGQHLEIKNTRAYGIGFQAGTTSFARIWLDSIYIQNAGDDGIDFKDPQTTNIGLFLSNILVDGWAKIVAGKAAFDFRGPVQAVNIAAINDATADANHGIRLRIFAAAPPNEASGRRCRISNFYIEMSGDNKRGLTMSGKHAAMTNGYIRLPGANALAVYAVGNASGQAEGNVVDAVQVPDCGGNALRVGEETKDNRFSITASGGTGIAARFEGANNEGNSLEDSEILDTGTTAVNIEAGVTGARIKRSRIARTTGVAVNIVATAADALIQGNEYEANSGVNLQDAGTDTVAEGDVEVGLVTPIPAVAAAALSIPYPGEVFLVSGGTAITSIDAASTIARRRVVLIFSGTPTFTDGGNLKIAGNLVASADDTITLVCDGTDWYEVGRAVN